jgi:prophage maintenance system killer protein
MDWQVVWIIFTACASAHIFYNIGKKIGISNTLDYLKADGQIDFDED